ncbi:thiamine monophosphate kinase [Campylobacter sputorum subsp. bovis]|nr:thiamine monophosphate kinase [Campylobacter sputorum]
MKPCLNNFFIKYETMDKEKFIISHFKSKFIGDDCAVVGNLVYAKDLFCENSHFKKGWLSHKEIAYKSMIVNISDIIVMNALPKYALIGLSVPKNIKKDDIKALYDGFNKACNEFNIEIIGGDTISSDLLSISVTMIGELISKPTMRKNLKMGDILCFTGELGSSLKSLQILQRLGKPNLKSRFFKPILRDKFFYKSSKFINAAMDISDGLSRDLERLADINGVNFKFIKKLSKFELRSGEEYEILFSVEKRKLNRVLNEAKKARIKVTPFAKVIKGRYKRYGKTEHF